MIFGPPVMVGMDPALIKTGIWMGTGLLLAILLFLVIRALRRRTQKSELPALPEIAPYDAAIKALDRMGTGPVHDAKAFYFDLGRIVKTYVGTVYGFNCLEMTTQELGKWIRRVDGLPGSLKSEITLFQDLCDPFRYAPLTPDPDRVNTDLAKGRQLICALEASRAVGKEED